MSCGVTELQPHIFFIRVSDRQYFVFFKKAERASWGANTRSLHCKRYLRVVDGLIYLLAGFWSPASCPHKEEDDTLSLI